MILMQRTFDVYFTPTRELLPIPLAIAAVVLVSLAVRAALRRK
jgi:hypothetical protein